MKHTLHKEMFHLFSLYKVMKKLRILSLFIILGLSACQKPVPPHEAVVNATSFCEAFYDLDYIAARDLATASSLPYLSFIATNTAQKHVDAVKARGPVVVSVADSQINEEEGIATLICSIKNSLHIDYFSGASFIIPEKQDTLYLIKEAGRWLVRMDNPLQSGTQSRD